MVEPQASFLAQTWQDGQLIDSVSVYDRALQYGDGFFTTVLVADQYLLNWSGHWRRLSLSANRLQFQPLDESLLLGQIQHALMQFDLKCHALKPTTKVVKILVSRGEAGRGYPIPEQAQVQTYIQISSSPVSVMVDQNSDSKKSRLRMPEPSLLHLSFCQSQAAIQAQIAGVKHLNRLDSVLARTEVIQKGHEEGLMLNAFDYVISGTQSNVFMIKDQDLITPRLNLSGVEGTTRYQLSQMAMDFGLNWQESDLHVEELLQADELFLSNAVRGIMPIKQLEMTEFSVCSTLEIHKGWSQWQANNALLLKDKE